MPKIVCLSIYNKKIDVKKYVFICKILCQTKLAT